MCTLNVPANRRHELISMTDQSDL